ncbi:LysM peptidoglycan-binding domain-containing protein [Brevibacillus dissolubilis]|uniref:LysM peptidoglycan-binding domain-containing protein n=1 Tax=Brevibacillus dissolubilis TaxID=1844116 RepID=UPI001116A28D|nr:LysM peptidoglycan-binding domain-containing protein [Brevibacillus dissolubilis]
MLHVVKPDDTLTKIANQYRTTVQSIMNANVICNPNYLFIGQPLIIPGRDWSGAKAGGTPYYVTFTGDTLECLGSQFSRSVASLARANQIADPNQLASGLELNVSYRTNTTPQQLFEEWNLPADMCDGFRTLRYLPGTFTYESFTWESFGEEAVPYLERLLRNPCPDVRYYAVMSLGRIGKGRAAAFALQMASQDRDQSVSSLAQLGLQRFRIVAANQTKRYHVLTTDQKLLSQPNLSSDSIPLKKGTPVFAIRWYIPSPTNEGRGFSEPHIYDLVQVAETGQRGYLVREGYQFAAPLLL